VNVEMADGHGGCTGLISGRPQDLSWGGRPFKG
jgi:hypothetical protein